MRWISHLLPVLAMGLICTTSLQAQVKDGDTKNIEVFGKTLDAWIADLSDPDPGVKEGAIRAIGNFGAEGRKAAPNLIPLLSSQRDISIKVNTCITLGLIGLDDKVLNSGVYALNIALAGQTSQAILRFQAAMALGRLGPLVRAANGYNATLNQLATVTIRDNDSWEIRKAAAYALGALGAGTKTEPADNRAINALLNVLGPSPQGDACGQVRLEAIFGISALIPTVPISDVGRFKPNLELRAKSDRDKTVSIYSWLLLMQIEPMTYLNDNNLRLIASLLKHPDLQVRLHATRALSMLGEKAKSTIPQLVDALRDKETVVATGATTALVAMKDSVVETHFQAIAKHLRASEPYVRVHACQALATFGERARLQVPELTATLSDKEAMVLVAACMALAEMGEYGRPALTALELLNKHPDDNVKEASFAAAEAIRNPLAAPPPKP